MNCQKVTALIEDCPVYKLSQAWLILHVTSGSQTSGKGKSPVLKFRVIGAAGSEGEKKTGRVLCSVLDLYLKQGVARYLPMECC